MDLLKYLDDHFDGPKLAPFVRDKSLHILLCCAFCSSITMIKVKTVEILNACDYWMCFEYWCKQEESKKGEAAELLDYADTFNKTGYAGLSMKGASPSEIEEVVGIASQLPANLKFGLHLTKCKELFPLCGDFSTWCETERNGCIFLS